MQRKAVRSALGWSSLVLCLFILNALLWLPAIWRRSDLFTLAPWPNQHLARGFYDLFLFYFARRPHLDFLHISYDLLLMMLIGALAVRFCKRFFLVRFMSILFMLSLTYQIYHELLLGFRGRLPLFREDFRLIEPSLHFLSDSLGWKIFPAVMLLLALGYGLFRFIEFTWDRLLVVLQQKKLTALMLLAIFMGYAHLCFYKYGPDRPDTIIRSSLYSAASNSLRSLTASSMEAKKSVLVKDSWTHLVDRNPPLLTSLPDIYLFVLESYGKVLVQDENMRPEYEKYMTELKNGFARKGWQMRSQMSHAPVFGGGSWLSLATMHNGIWIPDQETYDSLDLETRQKSRLLSLLESWGYETLGLMPGNRHEVGLGNGHSTPYGYQQMLEWKDIPYQGSPTNYAWIPDQYSLGWTFANRPVSPGKPRLFFFMSTNSHAPWKGTPPFLDDWRKLDYAQEPSQKISAWESFKENLRFAMELTQQKNIDRKAYLQSILYEWDSIAESVHRLSERPAIILVVGDHQPYFADAAHPHSPIHVLTKDPRMLSILDKIGFGQAELWRHDAIPRLILGLILKDEELLVQNGGSLHQSMSRPASQHAH